MGKEVEVKLTSEITLKCILEHSVSKGEWLIDG